MGKVSFDLPSSSSSVYYYLGSFPFTLTDYLLLGVPRTLKWTSILSWLTEKGLLITSTHWTRLLFIFMFIGVLFFLGFDECFFETLKSK